MKTKNLEALRNDVIKELTQLKIDTIIGSMNTFTLTLELVELDYEIMISKIVDLCLTGK